MTTTPVPPLPPRLVPVRQLGQGSTAEVLLVEWTDLAGQLRRGALKQPLLHRGLDADGVARLLRDEAALVARLVHPQIPRLLGYRAEPPALLFEHIDGVGLDVLLTSDERLTPSATATIVDGLLDVLAVVHALPEQVVHRDIDAHNVMIARTGDVVLIDFGTAIDNRRDRWTAAGGVRGSLTALSPEALRGEPIDARADLFAVGVLACRLWSGRDPFASRSPRERLERIARGSPTLTDIPPPLQAWCRRALAEAPTQRFATAADMGAALRAIVQPTPTERLLLAQRVEALLPPPSGPHTATRTR